MNRSCGNNGPCHVGYRIIMARFFALKYPLFAGIFAAVTAVNCLTTRFPVVRPSEKVSPDQIKRAHAEEYFLEARDRERRGLYAEAQRYYEKAYRLDPLSIKLREKVVNGYLNAGKFEEALGLMKNSGNPGEMTADDRRILAGIYWKMGEFIKAVETAEEIADKEESDLYFLARMFEEIGNAEKALQYYREYYRRNDESSGLALKIIRMQLAQKKYADAETLAVSTGKRHGEKAELYDLRGLLALGRGDTAEALYCFDSALAIDSSYENTLRNKALLYLQKNDYGKAIEFYSALYRIPGSYKAEYGRTLAMLYYYTRRYAEAVDLMTALAERFIGDADFHLSMGLAFAALEKNGKARIEIEKSIALREDYSDAWRELVNLSMRQKDYDEAFKTARRYCDRLPLDGASWRCAGYVLTLKKQYAGALSYFKKAVTLDSLDAGGWFELGSCYERSGDISRAADAFRRVLRLRPEDPAALNYLGYMWAEKGINLDSAKTLLESALSKEPANGAFLDSYAWIYYQQGDVDGSYRFITAAISRIHDDPVVFDHLGDILHKRNDNERAVQAYRRCLEYNPDNAEKIRRKIVDCEVILLREKRGY
jgi:tetratricopeptide (TPR) repeat protein